MPILKSAVVAINYIKTNAFLSKNDIFLSNLRQKDKES